MGYGATSADPVPTTNGSLTSAVYRGAGGTGLVFLYDLDLDLETE